MVMAQNPSVCASLFSSSSFLELFPASERSSFPSRTKLMGHTIPTMVKEIIEVNKAVSFDYRFKFIELEIFVRKTYDHSV